MSLFAGDYLSSLFLSDISAACEIILALGFLIRFSNSSATMFSYFFSNSSSFFSSTFYLSIWRFPSWPLSKPFAGANISLTLSIESVVIKEPEPPSSVVDCCTFDSSKIFFSFSLSSLNFANLSFHPLTLPPCFSVPGSSSFNTCTS